MTEAQLKRYGAVYVATVTGVVLLANLGWFPGTREAAQGLTHPYRLAMAVTVVMFSSSLGVLSAALGTLRSNWVAGLAALVAGGLLTGVALEFTPYVMYPDDQYSVAFMWVLTGAPMGLIAWVAFTIGSTMPGRGDAVA